MGTGGANKRKPNRRKIMTSEKLENSFRVRIGADLLPRARETPQGVGRVESRRSRVSQNTIVATAVRIICFPQPALLHGCRLLVWASILALIPNVFAADTPPVPAFPGAEGLGWTTRGGRGGRVIAVTNLNDSGPGSFREACEAEGPRIVVFRVSGTITLESSLGIRNPYITIAGQTAPGDGICIKKYPLSIGASEVIIRYIRVRLGDESGLDADAISGRYQKNIILDHVSASWSVDETVSIYHCENVTVQWCLVSESMYNSNHVKGAHGYGGIWGSNHSTYHHNLLAHHSSRNPRFASGCGYTDYRNNVVYNWGFNSTYGGEKQQQGNAKFNFSIINMVANYYKPGPATTPGEVTYRIAEPSSRSSDDKGSWYVVDNVVVGYPAVTADNWQGIDGNNYIKLNALWDAMPINQQTPENAYHAVLDHAGCSLPNRDAVDQRIIEEARTGTATYGNNGIITTPSDVGGWPELKSTPAPVDSDHDGIPDQWETTHGLDPSNKEDGKKTNLSADSYTNLEIYLNELAGDFVKSAK
jgi:pectate lyase